MLRIRKRADTSSGTRVKGLHPVTGEKVLIDPVSGAVSPWPLLGVHIVNDEIPAQTKISMSYVANAVAEGWASITNERIVHKPGGPLSDPWRITHTFRHVDTFTIHTIDGDVTYRMTHQPDKYDDPAEPSGSRVDWFYDMVREA